MISFVVPAHNEDRLLGATLDAIHAAAAAAGRPYEIVVASDASTDGTAAVAARHGARVVSVDVRHIAAARNAGARAARGAILIFVDADTLVTPAVVRAALAALDGGAVGGGSRARFEGRLPFYGHLMVGLWHLIQRIGTLAAGCFVFCTRAAFEAVGGFDESLYAAEELALSQKLKRQGRFVIVQEWVTTSGRTVRTHTAGEALRWIAAFALRGRAVFRSRTGPWYEPRRQDVL